MVRAAFAVVLVAAIGCGGDESGVPDAPGGSPADAPPGAIDGNIDAFRDGPPGQRCGPEIDLGCPANQFCDYERNGCGATDEFGYCRDRPTGCPDPIFVPTCGCDRVVYGSDCEAYLAGTDLNAYGTCPTEAGMFACGYTQCSLDSQYCRRTATDIPTEPDLYECIALPACPTQWPSCACLATEPCGDTCTGLGPTGLTVTCPGG